MKKVLPWILLFIILIVIFYVIMKFVPSLPAKLICTAVVASISSIVIRVKLFNDIDKK
jgi:hypothetical protein